MPGLQPNALLRRWTDRVGRLSPEGGANPLTRSSEKNAARRSVALQGALRLALQPEALVPGNRVTLLIDGEHSFGAMLDAIAAATVRIDVETYIWESDATGRRFAEALTERARAGVEVRCLMDGGGSFGTDESMFDGLRAAGGHVAVFHPVGPWRRRWGWSVRDHRKLLVVDDRLAFTGGLNLGDHYAPRAWGGHAWHDLHVKIEGPATAGFARLFEDAWRYVTDEVGRAPPAPLPVSAELLAAAAALSEPAAPGGIERRQAPRLASTSNPPGAQGPVLEGLVQPLAVGRRMGRRFIQRHYQYAVAQARSRVWISCAYFIPNGSWRRVLKRAAARGVDVRVLVPRTNDIPAVHFASRYTYQALLDQGVRIFEYLPAMLHAKAMVVDGAAAFVGSYNLDQRSLMYNWEIASAVIDPGVCGALEKQFLLDQEQSREIDPVLWPKRGLLHKLRERFWHFFRLLL